MSLKLSDAELEKLSGLPYFVRCVYVFGIRPYMDYATGTVGQHRGGGISYAMIAAALVVDPHQGLTESGSPTLSRVKRAVEMLEKAGLVERQSVRKEGGNNVLMKLIFFLPLAEADKSVSKKPGPNPDRTRTRNPDRNPNPPEQRNFTEKSGRSDEINNKPGPQPEPDEFCGCGKSRTLFRYPVSGKDPVSSGSPDGAPDRGGDAQKTEPTKPEKAAQVLDYLNQQAGTDYQALTPAGKLTRGAQLVIARINEGYGRRDFAAVIDAKVMEWAGDAERRRLLRPEVLFSDKHFSDYLGAAP